MMVLLTRNDVNPPGPERAFISFMLGRSFL